MLWPCSTETVVALQYRMVRETADRQDGGEPRLHPDVDEVRNLLIQDSFCSTGLAGLGFVGGASGADDMLRTDDLPEGRFVTDGFKAVLLFSARPRSISDVEILDWVSLLKRYETDAAVESTNAR